MRITGWYVRLERHDPEANRHRHYSLYFEPTLWHPRGALVLRWGRVSGFGSHSGYTRTGAPRGLPDTQARAAVQKTDHGQAAPRLPAGSPRPALCGHGPDRGRPPPGRTPTRLVPGPSARRSAGALSPKIIPGRAL